MSEFYNNTVRLKPALYNSNDILDKLYDQSNPSLSPPTFRILFMTDIELDLNYAPLTSSVNCFDDSCCHSDTPARGASDKAPIYGSNKCSMPLAGFKKMMDSINSLNFTSYLSVSSIILGGSNTAYLPHLLNQTTNVNS
jgi:hypothetical protein